MAAELKVDHFVRTADGTIGRIRYIGRRYDTDKKDHVGDLYADVAPAEGGESVELPLSELRRVPDPNSKRPPIEGIPEGERPRCPYCDKPLRLQARDEREKTQPYRIVKRTFWRYGKDGVFCTDACGIRFAHAALKAGYRIVRKK